MKIPGTSIEVDDFRTRDAQLYVLTHYHADHRKGLLSGDSRPMLCSSLTARLLENLHGVPPTSIRTLDAGECATLDAGVRVTAFDANHCPGALMFLFEANGKKILHTGDFRYSQEHDAHPELFDSIDLLLLDTTYGEGSDAAGEHATHEHPPQSEAIDRILALITEHPDHRVKLGVYRIGKNRVVQAIRDRLGLKTALSRDYFRIYDLIGMNDCVTTERSETRVHGYGMRYFSETANPVGDGSIAILPTGWTAGKPQKKNVFFVPYSEHCSGSELRRFIAKVNAREVVRTNDYF